MYATVLQYAQKCTHLIIKLCKDNETWETSFFVYVWSGKARMLKFDQFVFLYALTLSKIKSKAYHPEGGRVTCENFIEISS